MIQEAIDYQKTLSEIGKKVKNSSHKIEYIIKEIGLSHATFYRKIKTNRFLPEEVLKLSKILEPEEYYRWEFEKKLRESQEDINRGRITKVDFSTK